MTFGKFDFAVVWYVKGKSEKISGMFGSFQIFCGVGIERRFEKIPKIPVIFTLPWFVGSERDFFEKCRPGVGKKYVFSVEGDNGQKPPLLSLCS